jgi:hypothetical protein
MIVFFVEKEEKEKISSQKKGGKILSNHSQIFRHSPLLELDQIVTTNAG